MAHLNWTFKTYVDVFKVISSILVLTVNLWVALSQPNLIVFGICMSLCLISLMGFQIMKPTLFIFPLLMSTIILIGTIVTASSKGLTAQITQTLQFLLLIYTIEIGNSTIHFNRIIQKIKEPKPTPAMTKALKHYMANLTTIITASFTLSALLLFVGNLTPLKFEPIFLVATATAILLTTLAFLATNLPHPRTTTKT
ncbi:MAG: hypothetical protein QW270_04350 [Candidatus Bathyarchaeia archaeon]